MIKRTFLLLLTVVLTFSIGAQNTSSFSEHAKWTELPQSKRAPAPTVVGKSGSDFFLINTIKKKLTLQKYDLNTLSLKKSEEMILTHKGKKLDFESSFIANKTPIIITSFYNKKTRKKYLFYHTINTENLAISAPILMGEKLIPKKTGLYGISAMNDVYLTSSSDDMLSILVYPKSNAAQADIKTKNPHYIGKLFDENFSETEKCEFKIPFDNFRIEDYSLGDNGLFYILIDELIDNPEAVKKLFRGDKFLTKDTHLFIVDPKTGDSETILIQLENEKISELAVFPVSNGDISITGLTGSDKGVNGSFSILFDKNFVQVNNSIHKFEEDFVTSTWSQKKKAKIDKKNKKKEKKGKEAIVPEFYNYYLDYVVELSDGSVTMLAEQFFVRVVTRTSTVNGTTTTTTTYYYYYKDIIAVNYDKNGEFRWKKLIPKSQVSTNDGGYYSSYFIVMKDDNINIIYNEGLTAVKVKLQPDGEFSKENILQFTEEKRMRLVPKNCGNIGDGNIFLYARGRKGGKLGTLDIEK